MDSGRLGTNHDAIGRGACCSALDFSGTLTVARPRSSSGGRIWTCDLRVMNPTSYQTAPARVVVAVPDEEWDADPDALVCHNGTLHVPSGFDEVAVAF